MSTIRKYQKVKGYWCYCFIFPDGMFYIGCSGRKECWQRWQPQQYYHTTVLPYIEKYGWDNIRKVVLCDCLTEEQALQLEDLLILEARRGGWCINKQRSNEITKDNKYKQNYYFDNKTIIIEKQKQYYQKHKDERNNYEKKWYEKNKEEIKCKFKKRNTTPEGKIYNRVTNYNRLHPDCKIETPLEAKQKYLQFGYIPNYIKNNDILDN